MLAPQQKPKLKSLRLLVEGFTCLRLMMLLLVEQWRTNASKGGKTPKKNQKKKNKIKKINKKINKIKRKTKINNKNPTSTINKNEQKTE